MAQRKKKKMEGFREVEPDILKMMRVRRESLGLSRSALARRIGVDRATISRWERGMVAISHTSWETWNTTLKEGETHDEGSIEEKGREEGSEENEARTDGDRHTEDDSQGQQHPDGQPRAGNDGDVGDSGNGSGVVD